MDDNTCKMLTDLAAKLGTTAEKLSAVLVRNKFVNSLVAVVCATACFLVFAGLATWCIFNMHTDHWKIQYIAGAVFCCIATMVSFSEINSNLSGVIDPEGEALTWLIRRLS